MNKPNNAGKKALGSALAVLVLAAMLALTTWAALLAMAKSEKNTFLTGTVAIELNGGKTIFSGADLANIEPGHAAVREFTVKNTGTEDVYYRLYLENITGDLADGKPERIGIPQKRRPCG